MIFFPKSFFLGLVKTNENIFFSEKKVTRQVLAKVYRAGKNTLFPIIFFYWIYAWAPCDNPSSRAVKVLRDEFILANTFLCIYLDTTKSSANDENQDTDDKTYVRKPFFHSLHTGTVTMHIRAFFRAL